MSETTWVVLVSETIDGETTCQIVAEFDAKGEAEDFATDMGYSGAANQDWLVEVCTAEEAATSGVLTD